MKATTVISCLLLASATATAGEYTGKVYVDANRNGQFDKGEKTLKGWKRDKKETLVKSLNPLLKDLAEDLGWT